MKTLHKVLLVALVAIFSFGYAAADFRFGVKAGLNFNKLNYKIQNWNDVAGQIQDPGNQTGWMGGLMAEFTIPIINIGADASILYARQNVGKAEDEFYSNKNFLDIPINLKWKIGLPVVGKIVSPIIYTGPDFMFALDKDILKNVQEKKCEVGWNLGIGVELFRHLQIEGGYCFGLGNVSKYTKIFAPELNIPNADIKVKKNYWTLTAAYLF
ncbi:MAG: PorT family protein [Muribaculaceae bacterium]|nr:PorT family protein [Muribaculaceae bacterium]